MAKFGKICHIVQEVVEQAGLERKTLWTNQMRKDFDILAEKIRLTVQEHVNAATLNGPKKLPYD